MSDTLYRASNQQSTAAGTMLLAQWQHCPSLSCSQHYRRLCYCQPGCSRNTTGEQTVLCHRELMAQLSSPGHDRHCMFTAAPTTPTSQNLLLLPLLLF